ncbi:hypothetical protein TNCV_2023251 [Trichonephila clavipes]|nr:hypothetical protein TNCV_2023251 [Trichonephila clavipes]
MKLCFNNKLSAFAIMSGFTLNFLEAQWLSGSAFRCSTTGQRFKPWDGQVQLSLSSPQWVDKYVPCLLGNSTLGILRQTDHLTGTSAHAPQSPKSRVLISAQ